MPNEYAWPGVIEGPCLKADEAEVEFVVQSPSQGRSRGVETQYRRAPVVVYRIAEEDPRVRVTAGAAPSRKTAVAACNGDVVRGAVADRVLPRFGLFPTATLGRRG